MAGESPAMPPAAAALPAMAPRIDLLLCFADVFVGGVLCTRVALAMGMVSLWSGLEPGRKFALPLGLLLWYHGFMAKTSVVPKKRRGPAPTGKGVQIGERWHPSEIAAIDAWIESSADKTITRAHAIRRLVALGLKAKK